MKAMILAAGLGTRLRPLTDNRPKALVEISGRTLLEITLTRLRSFGVREVIINVHHFADMILDYLKARHNFGMRIEVSREEVLLDTGGGLKKTAWFFLEASSRSRPDQMAEPFILHNVDVISTIDIPRMLQFHRENNALATLAVQARETSRYLLFDEHLRLRGRGSSGTATPGCAPQFTATHNPSGSASPAAQVSSPVIPSEARDPLVPQEGTASQPTEPDAHCHSERSEESASSSGSPLVYPEGIRGATRLSRAEPRGHSFIPSGAEGPLPQSLAFSGIHVISPRLLPMITEQGIFSIIDAYVRLAAQGEKILAFRADQYYWRDLGRPADLAQAALDLQQSAP